MDRLEVGMEIRLMGGEEMEIGEKRGREELVWIVDGRGVERSLVGFEEFRLVDGLRWVEEMG